MQKKDLTFNSESYVELFQKTLKRQVTTLKMLLKYVWMICLKKKKDEFVICKDLPFRLASQVSLHIKKTTKTLEFVEMKLWVRFMEEWQSRIQSIIYTLKGKATKTLVNKFSFSSFSALVKSHVQTLSLCSSKLINNTYLWQVTSLNHWKKGIHL